MSKFSVNTKITIPGTIVETIENESVGVRYKVKIKSNDTLQYLWFEEDEIGGGSTPDDTQPDETPTDNSESGSEETP